MKKIKVLMRSLIVLLALMIAGLAIYRHFGMAPAAKSSGHQHHHHNHDDHANHPALIPAEGLGEIEEFELTNQDGKTFGSKDLLGSLWVANFVFTRCAGPCPIMSTRMARIQSEFGENKNLKYVSVSVDPDYDTPERLKEYGKTYGAGENWIFLTGEKDKVYDLIRKNFKLAVGESEEIPYQPEDGQILHSLHFVLVDEEGTIQGFYNSNDQESLNDLNVKLTHELMIQ